MKRIIYATILLLTTMTAAAQKPVLNPYSNIDQKALSLPLSATQNTTDIAAYINASFNSDRDKVRAIFAWITTNIQYDAANMYAINFYEQDEERIRNVLSSRKGICVHYAALFRDICTKVGLKAVVVEGYTKQNGATGYIPHAWCAARIDSAWLLYDPTWGSDYLSNGKFVKKQNNAYFSVPAAQMIRSHMPFDYLWQMLYYPLSSQEFYDGKALPDQSKAYFSYPDSIRVYEQLNTTEQLNATARRIEQNGVKNAMIFDRLQHIRLQLEHDKQERVVTLYNTASGAYNEGVNLLNEFIQYRNNQFKPQQPDAAIREMLDAADHKIDTARNKISAIKEPDASVAAMIVQINKSIADITTMIEEQQTWLNTYLGKGKAGRKSMFYKVSWFGIPLN